MVGADNYAKLLQPRTLNVFLYFSYYITLLYYSTGKLKLTIQELHNKIIQLELLKGIQLNRLERTNDFFVVNFEDFYFHFCFALG